MKKILVVEDDRAVQKALRRIFESEDFIVEVTGDGKSGLDAFRSFHPSAVVLDLRLPGMPGNEVCMEIKKEAPAVPVIVLSAKSQITDKVVLLELGADDYVSKPFSPRELLARVRTAIRHSRKSDAFDLTTFDGVCVDFVRMKVTFDGQSIELTAQEFKLLKFLLQNAERVISREELLRGAFDHQEYSSSRTVDN